MHCRVLFAMSKYQNADNYMIETLDNFHCKRTKLIPRSTKEHEFTEWSVKVDNLNVTNIKILRLVPFLVFIYTTGIFCYWWRYQFILNSWIFYWKNLTNSGSETKRTNSSQSEIWTMQNKSIFQDNIG